MKFCRQKVVVFHSNTWMYKLVFAYNRTNLPIKDTDEHPDNTKIDRSQEVSAKFKDIILAIFEVLMIRI